MKQATQTGLAMKNTILMTTILICAACFSVATPIANPAELPEGLLNCADERDDAKRLACYDAQIDALKNTDKSVAEPAESATGTTTPATPSGSDATEAAVIDQFGRTGKLAREDAPPVPDAITATITRIEAKPRGERIIHLDNGQVWEENARTRNLQLDAGDEITIESGFFGSFQLNRQDSNRFTRVIRVK